MHVPCQPVPGQKRSLASDSNVHPGIDRKHGFSHSGRTLISATEAVLGPEAHAHQDLEGPAGKAMETQAMDIVPLCPIYEQTHIILLFIHTTMKCADLFPSILIV